MLLRGLSVRVNLIAISPDEKFLCGCGEDSLLYIWDLCNGEVVFGQRVSSVVSVLQWVEHRKVRQYDEYELVLGHGSLVWGGAFTFAPDRVQWSLKQTPFTMPPGGNMVRTFTSLDVSKDGVFIYLGTTGGEMLVFRRDTGVFRACIPICTGGVQGIVTLPDDDIICAGGDGTICKVEGRDMTWHMSQSVMLDSAVKSLSLSANESELIIGCSSGSVYRCLAKNLSSHIVAEGHTSPVSCISFNPQQQGEINTLFATGTQSGEIRIWDLTDYACTAVCRYPKSGTVLCLIMIANDRVVSGWEDGFIRCHDTKTLEHQLWYIANAHRDGVTSISVHIDQQVQYLASGGGDGAVRVWRLGSREMVTQYTEHSKPISRVLIDARKPNIIHSVGRDSSVLSYDMKASRRIISHILSSSSGSSSGGRMMDMTQRLDSEQELITCDSQGRLLYWDIDYREPVLCVQDPNRIALHCCQVSPSGRFLAFSGDDQLLKVMELSSGQVLSLGQGHSSSVKAVIWTPDERQLITGGDDMSLCIWNWYLGGGGDANEDGRNSAPLSTRDKREYEGQRGNNSGRFRENEIDGHNSAPVSSMERRY
jgi:WD40 repeat protein